MSVVHDVDSPVAFRNSISTLGLLDVVSLTSHLFRSGAANHTLNRYFTSELFLFHDCQPNFERSVCTLAGVFGGGEKRDGSIPSDKNGSFGYLEDI